MDCRDIDVRKTWTSLEMQSQICLRSFLLPTVEGGRGRGEMVEV